MKLHHVISCMSILGVISVYALHLKYVENESRLTSVCQKLESIVKEERETNAKND